MPSLLLTCIRYVRYVRYMRCSAGAILLVPLLAFANEPAPNPHDLGVAESMLKYCARVDSADAGRWRQHAKQITHSASDAAVARIRKTEDYRAAYSSVTLFVEKVAKENAKRACNVPLTQNKPSAQNTPPSQSE